MAQKIWHKIKEMSRPMQLPGTIEKLNKLSVNETDTDSNVEIKELRLHIMDKNTRQKYLIYSGSIISVIPWTTTTNKQTTFHLTAANGSIIHTYGHRLLTIHLDLKRQFKWIVVVADVKTPIIGADFITHYGFLIDLKQHKLIDSATKVNISANIVETELHTLAAVDPKKIIPQSFLKLIAQYPKWPTKTFSNREREDIAHHFIVSDGLLMTHRTRKLSNEKLVAVKQEIQKLMDLGTVRLSTSSWSSPIHLTNGELWLCGNQNRYVSFSTNWRLIKNVIRKIDLHNPWSSQRLSSSTNDDRRSAKKFHYHTIRTIWIPGNALWTSVCYPIIWTLCGLNI